MYARLNIWLSTAFPLVNRKMQEPLRSLQSLIDLRLKAPLESIHLFCRLSVSTECGSPPHLDCEAINQVFMDLGYVRLLALVVAVLAESLQLGLRGQRP